MPHEWMTKSKAAEAAQTLCQISKDNNGNVPHELIAAYSDMLATARPAITSTFYEYLHRNCPDMVKWFVGPAAGPDQRDATDPADMQQKIDTLQDLGAMLICFEAIVVSLSGEVSLACFMSFVAH